MILCWSLSDLFGWFGGGWCGVRGLRGFGCSNGDGIGEAEAESAFWELLYVVAGVIGLWNVSEPAEEFAGADRGADLGGRGVSVDDLVTVGVGLLGWANNQLFGCGVAVKPDGVYGGLFEGAAGLGVEGESFVVYFDEHSGRIGFRARWSECS